MNKNVKLLRLPEVMEMVGFKKSHIWKMVKEGKFPKQYKLSYRVSVWKESEVQEWIAKQLGEL